MQKKHSAAKHTVHAVQSKKKSYVPYIIAALVILVIVAVAYNSKTKSDVVAAINGEKITAKRIDALYNSQPKGSALTKAQILNSIINTKVLVDYIQKKGFDMTDEQVQTALSVQLKAKNISMTSFMNDLTLRGATLEDVKDTFLIEKFMTQQVIPTIQITDADIAQVRRENNATTAGVSDAQIRSFILADKQRQFVATIIQTHRPEMNITIYNSYQ